LESSSLQGQTVTYQVDALQVFRNERPDGNGKFDDLVEGQAGARIEILRWYIDQVKLISNVRLGAK